MIAAEAAKYARETDLKGGKTRGKTPVEWGELAYQIVMYGRFVGGRSEEGRAANAQEHALALQACLSIGTLFEQKSLLTDVQVAANHSTIRGKTHIGHISAIFNLASQKRKGTQVLNVNSAPRVISTQLYTATRRGPNGEDVIPDDRGNPVYLDPAGAWRFLDPDNMTKSTDTNITSDHDPFLTRVLFPTKDIDILTLTWNVWSPASTGGWGHGLTGQGGIARETAAQATPRMERVAKELAHFVNYYPIDIIHLQEIRDMTDRRFEDRVNKENAINLLGISMQALLETPARTTGTEWQSYSQPTISDLFNIQTFYRKDKFTEEKVKGKNGIQIGWDVIKEQLATMGHAMPTSPVQENRILPVVLKTKDGKRVFSINTHLKFIYHDAAKDPSSAKYMKERGELSAFLNDILSVPGMDVVVMTGDNNLFLPNLPGLVRDGRQINAFRNSSLSWAENKSEGKRGELPTGRPNFASTDGSAVDFSPIPSPRDLSAFASYVTHWGVPMDTRVTDSIGSWGSDEMHDGLRAVHPTQQWNYYRAVEIDKSIPTWKAAVADANSTAPTYPRRAFPVAPTPTPPASLAVTPPLSPALSTALGLLHHTLQTKIKNIRNDNRVITDDVLISMIAALQSMRDPTLGFVVTLISNGTIKKVEELTRINALDRAQQPVFTGDIVAGRIPFADAMAAADPAIGWRARKANVNAVFVKYGIPAIP